MSPSHWVCPCSRRVCFPSLHHSGFRLLCGKQILGCVYFPGLSAQVQILGYSTMVQTCLGLRFVPFPGLSSSGDRVLGEHGSPQLEAATYHLPCPCHSVFWVYNRHTFSGMPCVSSGELISVTLLVDVDRPESQEVLVSNKACLQFGR